MAEAAKRQKTEDGGAKSAAATAAYLKMEEAIDAGAATLEPKRVVNSKSNETVDPFPQLQFRALDAFPTGEDLDAWRPSGQPAAQTLRLGLIYDKDAFAAILGLGKLESLRVDEAQTVPGGSVQIVWRREAPRATVANWTALARESLENREAGGLDALICVGGGTCVDAAKWVAAKLKVHFVCIPSAITVDAFFTGWSGCRVDGCVKYERTKPPDCVCLDLALLGAAPPRVRAAGLCDVLSIATGLSDWVLAENAGRCTPEHKFDPAAAAMARGILQSSISCAASAGRGEPEGLRRLIDALCWEVTLCNQLGHSRPEEGSEHFLCYALEAHAEAGRSYTHAEYIGVSLLVMGTLQGIDVAPLREAYRAAGAHPPAPLPCRWVDFRSAGAGLSYSQFSAEAVRKALHDLPQYCAKHGLWYSVAHTVTAEDINALDLDAILAP